MRMFISYSHKDKKLFEAFRVALKSVQRSFPQIDSWEDTQILAGNVWDQCIRDKLNASQMVVLLVSPDFVASDYIWEKELAPALERASRNECVVVPVIVRQTAFWTDSPFAHLQALPSGGAKPVKTWPDRDVAWANVLQGLIAMAAAKGLVVRHDCGSGEKNALFHVPFARNHFFTGRGDELKWLDEKLGADQKRPVALLAGMGGVGKTCTAIEYGHARRDTYAVVWWVDAETASSRDAGFSALAAKLGLPEATAPDMTIARSAVLDWMNANTGWLVVFDNAACPKDLAPWFPMAAKGRILITSRDEAWGAVASVWGVREWETSTATSFLLERTKSDDHASAKALAEKLGCLPLACEQAGAYVVEKRVTLARFLELFNANAPLLLEGAVFGGHEGLSITVRMSLESLETGNPLALAVLRVLTRLAPDDIPRDLLKNWKGASAMAVDDAVAALFRAALIRGDSETLSLHRLLRELIRAADPNPRDSDGTAMVLLHKSMKDCGHAQTDIQHWPRLNAIAPHAAAILDYPIASLEDSPHPDAAGSIYNQLGTFFHYVRGDLIGAKKWFERAVALSELRFRAENSNAAARLSNLGLVLVELGDHDSSEKYYERALAISEQLYGGNHPEVAITLNNIGRMYHKRGELVCAKSYYERALEIDMQAYGPKHDKVARRIYNLGRVLQDQNDPAGAEAHFSQALPVFETEYGSEHPDVAALMINLGLVLQLMGDLAGAKAYAERSLNIREKILPKDHPDITKARHNLAAIEAEIAIRKSNP